MEELIENEARIPESVIINGVTYVIKDTPELQKFIQEVAKVEKNKLYSKYKMLKQQIDSLQRVTPTGGVNADDLVDKLKGTFITVEDLKEQLPSVIKQVVQPLLNASEKQQHDELNAYREKLISENIATCIPELVKGETKEELDAALKESIRIRSAYPSPSMNPQKPEQHVTDPLIESQAQQMGIQGMIEPTPTQQRQSEIPAPSPVPRRTSPEVTGASNVKQMTMSEFEKQRDSLKAQLESIYGGGSL